MKTQWMLCVLFVAISVGFFAGVGFSEDPKPDEDDVMKKMMELGKPGPMHKLLDHMSGEFDCVTKSWHQPGEPDMGKGVATYKWLHGGRYLRSEFRGSFGPMKYEGSGVLGFDNFKKQFQQIWMDNQSSSMSLSTGSLGKDGKTIDLSYVWDGPMGKIPARMRYTIQGKDSHMLEAWMTMGGNEVKNMEFAFTRRMQAPNAKD